MSFREKSAWVTLLAILLVSTLFGLHAPSLSHPQPHDFHSLAGCIAAFLLIEAVAFLVLRLKYPEDARTPLDEREELIHLKAARLASACYGVGSLLAVLSIHHGVKAPTLAYLIVFAFVTAEVVKYGARILYYRRGV